MKWTKEKKYNVIEKCKMLEEKNQHKINNNISLKLIYIVYNILHR